MKKQVRSLKLISIASLALAVVIGCGQKQTPSDAPSVGLHQAVIGGDLEAVRQHIAAGSDLNQKDPLSGASPLMTAATFGQTEVARALIDAGADLNSRNNDGATALHTAAFFCRTEIVELLLENGADASVRNNAGATALETVIGPFDDVKGIYDFLAEALRPLGLRLNYERIKATRPQIAEMLR